MRIAQKGIHTELSSREVNMRNAKSAQSKRSLTPRQPKPGGQPSDRHADAQHQDQPVSDRSDDPREHSERSDKEFIDRPVQLGPDTERSNTPA